MTKKEEILLNKGLPKWPKMYVTGNPIEKEQALEIIRRTDSFFSGFGGNNVKLDKKIREIISMPSPKDFKDFIDFLDAKEQWDLKWNLLDIYYTTNSWISTCFIYGANGWCHPDGKIGFSTNIGKYPDVKNVYNEWKLIAKEFPFLELGITLYNGEHCEEDIKPVVSIKVEDGKAFLIDPEEENVHQYHEYESCSDYLENNKILSSIDMNTGEEFKYTEENQIPLEQFYKWKNLIEK